MTPSGLRRWRAPTRRRRAWVVIAAAALFAGVFALQALAADPNSNVTLLYALPIALLAVELGVRWGLAAAAVGLSLFAATDILLSPAHDASAVAYLTCGAAFFVVAGCVGALADGLREVSAEGERFWVLSGDLLCSIGFDGDFRRLNPAWERALGWTTEELCARPFIELIHPDDRERTELDLAALTGGRSDTSAFENRCRCKDGAYLTLLWGARSLPRERLVYATAKDITAFTRAQQQLRSSERFLDSVLENLPSMVFVKDADELRFVRSNRAGEELIGRPLTGLIGKSDHDLFPEHEADAFVRADREVLAAGGVVDIPEEQIETLDGGSRILHTRKIAIRDEHGRARYLLGISEDITERKLAEQAATAAQAEAERANHAKSAFLSRMSHELRTPLNAVIGFGQLLELDDLDARQDEAVEQILKAGRHLLALINEVLDISRIESGTMSLSLEPVPLAGVLAEALSLVGPLAEEAQVRLVAEPSEHHVLADQQRLKQVLINVLANAVKYNRSGGRVAVRCHELPGERVGVAVEDTGHGITGEQLRRLFDPFDRLGAERTDVEGTGLGLPLSRGLIESMGGSITAESRPGVGTTLRIELDRAEPAASPETPTPRPVIAAGGATTRSIVVYIEDNLSNLRLVERLLERVPGVRLIPAMQGSLGLELARRHRPDLVLLDLHLPDVRGQQVLEQLKGDPTTSGIPVVILSADATPAQLERLLAAGADGYLTKPIDVDALLATIREIPRTARPS